ncbi:response regulator transcription factor [Cuneatibacter sp. NSJ-177]|uniref:response regulator transcription factor n=1 Tax=Cuneatibacter sp. NSJ-177 TaxID=2931401 RepID=UPI001FD574A9|nr:response regulator transcription factor [Cuneatibacter sp. NSJ-177]MCJ7835363.1 response regulator transcription factor [Cuneatibacter sp. NSJ-177]
MRKILIVEDDAEIAMLEKDYLNMSGYSSEVIGDGLEALEALRNGEYELVLLDLMLPGCDGYEICRLIRDEIDIPILMVTARVELPDRLHGLQLGADDYILKPFDPAELVARVISHLRRYERLTEWKAEEESEEPLTAGDIRIDPRQRSVYVGDREVRFPKREFDLLKYFVSNPNVVHSKKQLFETIWGYDSSGDLATVTVHVNRIRDKIEKDPSNPKRIETVWGIGYRFHCP